MARANLLLVSATGLAAALSLGGAIAEDSGEYRQHGTHQHGVGELNLAREGAEVQIEMESPAANILGFEHAPGTAAEHATLKRAIDTLKHGGELFRFSEDAQCRLVEVLVDTPLMDPDHDQEPEQGNHPAHKDEHDNEHDGKHDDSDADQDPHGGETHADITARYRFTCSHPMKLQQIDVGLFRAFPATGRLVVQYISDDKQGAAELTATNRVLKF